MPKLAFPEWLKKQFRKSNVYSDDALGCLARCMNSVIRIDIFGEEFDKYDTLENGWSILIYTWLQMK